MKKNNNNSLVFAEKEPSLFIVQTPFQAMCAINAIRQLHIEEYVLSLHLHPTTEKRNKQTVELVERYGYKYSIVETKPLRLANRVSMLFGRKGHYRRVFLGTHLNHDGYVHALSELRNGGNLVLLDDGIATLALLKDEYKAKGRSYIYMVWNKVVATMRRISLNNVFTVYKNVYNPKWNIAFNDISLLRQLDFSGKRKNVIFIGTNNSGFINEGIDEVEFKKTLYNVLKKVKMSYPQEEITYIPHGRDKSSFVKEFCKELGISYKPLDVNVEIFLLSMEAAPLAIYGFTSSALYNLKMLYPESDIHNFVMKILTDKYPSILDASSYYEKQGILTERV